MPGKKPFHLKMDPIAYRIRDVLLAIIALVILSPVLLCVMCLLKVTQSKVFFRQQRPGLHERPFWLIKFSTLRDAPVGWKEEERQMERLTPVGKFLRKNSLDELPQLWNVLRGEMSLVGPRPLLMSYLPIYTARQRQRHQVLPGITGWAQVHGRNRLSFTQRFEYDCWYVDHRSFWLDLRILAMTFLQVAKPREAFADEHTTSPLFDGSN